MIITVAGYKGGVGKTTTALHIAGYLQTKAPAAIHRKVKAASVLEGVELSALVADLLAEWTDRKKDSERHE